MKTVISECGKYRYQLHRQIIDAHRKSIAVFVMLNPSTADHTTDDPTIRRCIDFAKQYQHTDLIVINLYAFRTKDPQKLMHTLDPVGPLNQSFINKWLFRSCSDCVIYCAWGNNVRLKEASDFIHAASERGAKLICLGKNKSGSPKHPLYLPKDSPRQDFP